MKARRYVQRQDGEGFEVPLGELYRLACCDCGLVHDVVWVFESGKLAMATSRNNRATAQRRRKTCAPSTPQPADPQPDQSLT